MPRVRLIADDGWIALDERVTVEDFDTEHFRRHLAERLALAAGDAEGRAPAAPEGAGDAEAPRFLVGAAR